MGSSETVDIIRGKNITYDVIKSMMLSNYDTSAVTKAE